jgi:geranylgeranyl pyrophosphate synthase
MQSEKKTLVLSVEDFLKSRSGEGAFSCAGISIDIAEFTGKMLRTRLAQALAGENWEKSSPHLVQASVSVELIHTASLFHDDVVDGASLRRGKPALWRVFTPSSAVLIGDLFFCEALSVLLETGNSRIYRQFNMKVKEVCEFEARQEIFLRGSKYDRETCVDIARGKTGPLFAFAAMMCAGDNRELEVALEEAGYRIGCAYQIADDILDEESSESSAGKTLGTDRLRRKFTLAQGDVVQAREVLARILESATYPLASWPEYEQRLGRYIAEDFSANTPSLTKKSKCVPC